MNGLRRYGVYIYNGIILSHRKEQFYAICSNVDGDRDSNGKWSKSERERQMPCDITYIWNLTYGINAPFHRKETHGPGQQTCGCLGKGEGVGWTGSLGLMDANYCLLNG